MKKITTVLVILGLFLSLTPSAFATNGVKTFTDVADHHWAYGYITNGVNRGYINGLPDGSFAPDENVKRSEFIKMTVAALGLEIDSEHADPWYVPYVESSKDHSLILDTEYADGNYNTNMSRMEMVRVAVKAINEEARNDEILNEELMLMATQMGVIRGMNDGKLVPDGLSTRAQAVAVIERMFALLNGETLAIDEEAVEVADIEYSIATGDVWDKTTDLKRIRPEIARYYEMQIHESFNVENGHLKGYLPKLPYGLEYGLSFRVYYDPADKVTATDMDFLNYDVDLNPGESFSLPIPHEDKVQRMMLHVSVMVSETGSKRRYSNMEYFNDREITEHVKY